jgi:hypothetical protein
MEKDPFETTNLFTEYPEVVKKLAAELNQIVEGNHTRKY